MKTLLTAVLLIAGAASTVSAEETFYLKSGDRVVFYGDSITDQRLYNVFVETYVLTRFPKLNVSFVHSGWGGDRVTGGGGGPIDTRLPRDVYEYKPTVMTVMLGMNDGSYRAFDQTIFDTYANGYKHIIESVKNNLPGVRVTLIQPSPFDDVTRPAQFEGGYNAVLVRYGKFVADLARDEKFDVVDFNAPVVAVLEKAKGIDADLAGRIIPDRVHPGPGGHLIMAESLLKAWNAPALVTSVTIDAAARKVVDQQNAVVKSVDAVTGGVMWKQRDSALPMAVDFKDRAMQLAIQASDFTEALNQQRLKVTGLSAAKYALKIDGKTIASFSKDELASGINLTAYETPMMEQAARVHQLTRAHNDIHFARWRWVQVVPYSELYFEGREPSMKALDKLETEMIARQRLVAQPIPHTYELTAE